MIESQSRVARRSFVSRLGAGVAAFAATLIAEAPRMQAQSTSDARWQPTRHAQDDWFDQIPGKHRLFFDTTTPDSLADAIQFAGNYFSANKSGYALENTERAIVVCLRHRSAPFGLNNAMWAKYGVTLAARAEFTDPKTKQVPMANLYAPAPAGPTAPARGLVGLGRRGVQIAQCDLSTHAIAGLIARDTGGKADEVYKEITANLIDNARLVPAGIVAVNRAQERGYSIT